jgi:hypothetical protein
MFSLRAVSLGLLVFGSGCAGLPARLPIRVLSSEAANVNEPSLEVQPASSTTNDDVVKVQAMSAPRIGAPGGSGAGSRRVIPL